MDQERIGKFIKECRKNKKLTQEQLAEKLGVTYKAVSKWETGKCLPDASLMLELCNILDITVNDLLSGEVVNESKYKDTADINLIKLQKQKEKNLTTIKYTHIATIIIFLIFNLINFVTYGVELAVSDPVFTIAIISSLIYYIIYLIVGEDS